MSGSSAQIVGRLWHPAPPPSLSPDEDRPVVPRTSSKHPGILTVDTRVFITCLEDLEFRYKLVQKSTSRGEVCCARHSLTSILLEFHLRAGVLDGRLTTLLRM